MKKLPLGIQSFRKLINGDYVYVDKTQFVYTLLNDSSYYFLSRPRRFGKSLLLDTIGEAFSGDKELFKDLFIYNTDYAFDMHPVLHLDMSVMANYTQECLINEVTIELKKRIKYENFDIESGAPAGMFRSLIESYYVKYGKTVVVLIDEYDKPIIDNLNNPEIAEANRNFLRGFYGVLKSMDTYLRLTFITGVSKFTKTSIFSGLNNLRDISLSKKYTCICGIEVAELNKYFADNISNMSSQNNVGEYKDIYENILRWYDGYSWDGVNRLINPYSLLNFFNEAKFSGYWFDSGTPKFLIDIIKKRPDGFSDLNDVEMGDWALNSFDLQNLTAAPLLFQTGYLTIKKIHWDQIPPVYSMGAPNHEVKMAFNLNILSSFTENDDLLTETIYRKIKTALEIGDLNSALESLKALFSSIPYELHIKREAYYHSIFYAIMNIFGFNIDAEVSVSGGRIDAVLELADKVYIFEFIYIYCADDVESSEKQKITKKTLDEGIGQIKSRGYANKYIGQGKKIYLAAFAFLGRDDINMRIETT